MEFFRNGKMSDLIKNRRLVVVTFLVTLLLVAALSAWPAFAAIKVTLCHFPPSNPSNSQTITVSENAVPGHLAHGDTFGPCYP